MDKLESYSQKRKLKKSKFPLENSAWFATFTVDVFLFDSHIKPHTGKEDGLLHD